MPGKFAIIGAINRSWTSAIAQGGPRGSAVGLCLYLCLAVYSTWPLAAHVSHAVPIGTESNAVVPLFNVWTIWWNVDRLGQLYQDYWNAPIFLPAAGVFALSEAQPLTALLAPLVWLMRDPVGAYNCYLLLALALNGWSAFCLLRRIGCEWLPALLGGAIVELLPFVFWELGVLQAVPLFGVIWTLDALYAFGRGPSARRGVLLGLAFAATYLISNNHGLFLSVLLAGAGVWLLEKPWTKRFALSLALSAIVTAAAIYPVLGEQLRSSQLHGLKRSIGAVQAGSAEPFHYAVVPWPQLLAPRLVDPTSRVGDRTVRDRRLFPGFAKICLALLGLSAGLTDRRTRRFAGFCGTVLAASFVLSLGPRFEAGDGSLYRFLMDFYPGFRNVRAAYRYALFFQLALAFLAALGMQAIWQSLSPRRLRLGTALVLLVGLLATFEIRAPSQRLFHLPSIEENHGWLSWLEQETPADSVVAFVPFSSAWTAEDFMHTAVWMYWGTHHRRAMVNGYSGFFPRTYGELKTAMRGFPNRESIELLTRYGVDYCVVRRSVLQTAAIDSSAYLSRQLELNFSDEVAGIDIYRLGTRQ